MPVRALPPQGSASTSFAICASSGICIACRAGGRYTAGACTGQYTHAQALRKGKHSNTPMTDIYLDYAATTPVHPQVRAAMAAALETHWANPSSVHRVGSAAAAAYRADKQRLLQLLGLADTHGITVTASASEATSLLMLGWAATHADGTIAVGATEHSCVLEAAKVASRRYGVSVIVMPVDSNGQLQLDELRGALAVAPGAVLLCTMAANNETGVLADMQGIAATVAELRGFGRDITWHSDMVQYVATLPCADAPWLAQLDALTLTAHKLGAPRGAGALVARQQVLAGLQPQVLGGGQEAGLRSGTEATILFHAMVKGLALHQEQAAQHMQLAQRRDALQAQLLAAIPGAQVAGGDAPRLPGHLMLTMPDTNGESLVQVLSSRGLHASTGSACASNDATHSASHVLQAMGVSPALVSGSLRTTLGWETTDAELTAAAELIPQAVAQLQQSW